MTDEKIAYEPHPVSPERKAELRAAGYKIIDERFKPADDGKVSEADERHALIAELQERGVEFDEAWPTDELRALLITKLEVLAETLKEPEPEPEPEPARLLEARAKRGRKPA